MNKKINLLDHVNSLNDLLTGHPDLDRYLTTWAGNVGSLGDDQLIDMMVSCEARLSALARDGWDAAVFTAVEIECFYAIQSTVINDILETRKPK